MTSRLFFTIYYTNVKELAHIAFSEAPCYAFPVFISEYFIVYPEGDSREISGRLRLNQLVDMNGNPLDLPLPTSRMIAFRVEKIKTSAHKGGEETYHFLEQLSADELTEYLEE